MKYVLPKLPYGYADLEPYIDKETMTIHHTKHHQAYVDNLNKAIESYPDLQNEKVEDLLKNIKKIPEEIRQAVVNNGGGHVNHSFFWSVMSPKKTAPGEKTSEVLKSTFGSIDKFKEDFTSKAMSVFGSGWAFLIMTADKKYILKRHSFQNSPIMNGNVPILGIDVWEHAYYLKYQNRRAEYVDAWWNVINWVQVEENISKSLV